MVDKDERVNPQSSFSFLNDARTGITLNAGVEYVFAVYAASI